MSTPNNKEKDIDQYFFKFLLKTDCPAPSNFPGHFLSSRAQPVEIGQFLTSDHFFPEICPLG